MSESVCPLCNLRALVDFDIVSDSVSARCDRCGIFRITEEALPDLSDSNRPKLSAYCRKHGKSGNPVLITTENIESLANAIPDYSPLERRDNLLLLLAERAKRPSQSPSYSPETDYPLIAAADVGEIEFYRVDLMKRGYITTTPSSVGITMQGWKRVSDLKKVGRRSDWCFVAMWFDGSTNALYDDAIKPAIEDAGYRPLRIDKHEHTNRIDDEIIAQIKRCRFMVADFSGQRHGVYFEAGMMKGLGRQVIWLCNEPELSNLHFDVRQFNFIAYKVPGEVRKRLYDRITATEGDGPVSKAKKGK